MYKCEKCNNTVDPQMMETENIYPYCSDKCKRTKELEQCRDEVRAVLEKHNAFLSANPSGMIELCCNKENYPECEIDFEEL